MVLVVGGGDVGHDRARRRGQRVEVAGAVDRELAVGRLLELIPDDFLVSRRHGHGVLQEQREREMDHPWPSGVSQMIRFLRF
jgi:hypothetical protein